MLRFIILTAFVIFGSSASFAQFQTVATEHYLLGVDVKGFEIEIPFAKEKTEAKWKVYAKSFGKSETTSQHNTYQSVFKAEVYAEQVLIYSQIKGDAKQSSIWVGIDPQGIPKDIYPQILEKLEQFVYDFNISMRREDAQKLIDESEQAASYLSKEFETLKNEERRREKSQERTEKRIESYEQKLVELRADSTQNSNRLETLSIKTDSLYLEIEKIKGVMEVFRKRMEDIK